MQQAIYNNTGSGSAIRVGYSGRTASAAGTAKRGAGILRWITRKWDLVGVVALMGSSMAYGIFALAHLG